jgi:2-methylisocitrate lyase-like PEP mutase family enzyme
MVFLEGADSVETIRQAVAGIDGPVAVNLVEGGKTPAGLNFATLQQLGVARVSLPSTAMQAMVQAVRTVFARVLQNGGIEGYDDLLAGFGVAQRLLGRDAIFALEERFMAPLIARPEQA